MKTNNYFQKAVPVWEKGRSTEMNTALRFSACVPKPDGDVRLRLTASASYLLLINGKVASHGPARCAHGYHRVDELLLNAFLTEERNALEIRVSGYYCANFAYVRHPSFLVAELTEENGDVIAYTSPHGGNIKAYPMPERIQSVPRYSYQRPFCECWDFTKSDASAPVLTEEIGIGTLLERRAPYGTYPEIFPEAIVGMGTFAESEKGSYGEDRARTQRYVCESGDYDDPGSDGFAIDKWDVNPYALYGRLDFAAETKISAENPSDFSLKAGEYAVLDMGADDCGLFAFDVGSDEDTQLLFDFDEVFSENGAPNPFRMGCCNVLPVKIGRGTLRFCTAEPYGFRALRVSCLSGSARIQNLRFIRVGYPQDLIRAKCRSDDPTVKAIFDAAIRTFSTNTADIYMDCPTRERAGWLCDSFFTSKVEYLLTGKSLVERDFLENFILPETLPHIPKGMLPMCYPSDHKKVEFIPNWAMFYGLELKDYLSRTGDRAFIDRAKDKMYALIDYFTGFENENGLLESLDSWIFVEWSRANQLVRDVSYPSNMLYTAFLDALGDLYDDRNLHEKAAKIREEIRKEALTESGFFCDNAQRRDGKLVLSGECTEVCQYYAFYFGVATPEKDAKLWKILLDDFGFERRQTGKYPEIAPANAFIGNYLRLDMLEKVGEYEKLLENIRSYFGYMANKTGTLWENEKQSASCNHGFASYVLVWLYKLGLVSFE